MITTVVYLADLQAYEEGYYVARRVELPISDEEYVNIRSEVLTEGEHVTGTEDHEELCILSYEGVWDIMSDDDFDEVNEIAGALASLDTDEENILDYLIGYEALEISDALDKIYQVVKVSGDYGDVAAKLYDEQYFGDTSCISDSIRNAIDWDELGSDLRHEGWTQYGDYTYYFDN